MYVPALSRSIYQLGKSFHLLKQSGVLSQVTFSSNFRGIFFTRRMASDISRVKAKAEQTEKILSDLQAQIEAIKKAAVKQAGLGEEEKLFKENEELKKEIESIRKALVLAEIGNGVRQVQMPTKGALSAISTSVSKASPAPMVNGKTPKAPSEEKPKGQKVEATGKKTKSGEQTEAGGKKAKTEKGGKGEGGGDVKPKKAGAATGGGGADAPVDISRLDMRVGKIVAVEKHPDADGLYVEQVDVGEGRNRTIISGLVKHYPLNAMKDRIAVFMCNLKPAKMRGIMSEGMIMCATGPEKTEILVPPADADIGDRVFVEKYPGTPDGQLNPKKKIWETLKPDVRTDNDRVACYKGAPFTIEGKGVVVAPTLADAQIS